MGTQTQKAGSFTLPVLPYAENALAPAISAQTINFHYHKHHAGYIDKLNSLVSGTAYADLSLEEVIRKSWQAKEAALFNNAAQAWNHTFYWRSLKPKGGGKPTARVQEKIAQAFGDVDTFKKKFSEAALGQFGSGWAWLVQDKGSLKIVQTANAETPIASGITPLLTIDVWEHAYYLDYQNSRANYVSAVIDHLLNWDFAEENLR